MSECQVSDPTLREILRCKHTESGGVQCERMDFHVEGMGCRISEHSIRHSIAGNGWDCSAFNEPVDITAYRLRLRMQIQALEDELEALEPQKTKEPPLKPCLHPGQCPSVCWGCEG